MQAKVTGDHFSGLSELGDYNIIYKKKAKSRMIAVEERIHRGICRDRGDRTGWEV